MKAILKATVSIITYVLMLVIMIFIVSSFYIFTTAIEQELGGEAQRAIEEFPEKIQEEAERLRQEQQQAQQGQQLDQQGQTATRISSGSIPLSAKSYVFTGSQLIYQDDDSNTIFNTQDYLGSARIGINEKGEKVSEMRHYPFGETLIESSDTNADQRFKFTGKERDSSRLMYFGARYYDPPSGRFISVDPISIGVSGIRQSVSDNLYVYARNNPIKIIDPTGNRDIEIDDSNKPETQNDVVETVYITTHDFMNQFGVLNEGVRIFDLPDSTARANFENWLLSLVDKADTTSKTTMRVQYPAEILLNRIFTKPDTSITLVIDDLRAIPQVVNLKSQALTPFENIVFAGHGANPDSLKGINDFSIVSEIITADSDTVFAAFTPETMTKALTSIPQNALAQNAKMIIISCYGNKCIDTQAVADSLDIPVYSSGKIVTRMGRFNPQIFYGEFDANSPIKPNK